MSMDFHRENKIIDNADKIINEKKNDTDFYEEYRLLSKDYKRLLRQLVKLTTISDKLQQKLISTQENLKELSITDSLTKLYNRRKLDEVLNSEYNRSKRSNDLFSIIILDIDKFKDVNDTFGHNIGDSVLIEFATLLQENIRKTDIIGRWGGEEFLIIAPYLNLENALILAEKLRKIIEKNNFSVINKKTASFGVAEYNHEDTLEDIIIRADTALYSAKKNGRNCVEG